MILKDNCKCCNYIDNFKYILFENDTIVCVSDDNDILIGSCYIIPKEHKETPFDLSDKEWADTKKLITIVKNYLDDKYAPDGYNLGWNVGSVGGQFVFHSHLHIIPRYKSEPLAGKGIRHWLMQEENRRTDIQ
ncbi:MAG: HIT family protein [Bacilli bacterium]|nr:HIT family protein [Bacilli bacterium]